MAAPAPSALALKRYLESAGAMNAAFYHPVFSLVPKCYARLGLGTRHPVNLCDCRTGLRKYRNEGYAIVNVLVFFVVFFVVVDGDDGWCHTFQINTYLRFITLIG